MAYTIRLPRLPVNWKEQPALFERYWDEAMGRLEDSLNAILQIPAIQTALAQAQADIITAQATADFAQDGVDSIESENSLVNSYISGFMGTLLTADSTGAVAINNHSRIYGNPSLNPTVSVTGGTITTSRPPGTVIRVYYDDPTRSGGAVTYYFTADPATPPVQSGVRHSVGAVIIPSSGSQGGEGVNPPGYVIP